VTKLRLVDLDDAIQDKETEALLALLETEPDPVFRRHARAAVALIAAVAVLAVLAVVTR
jgi:ATP phosphoribosyltransferase regulatory subunit HisZ